MDYPFENLDPETFQQFAQSLLLREKQNLQCFPVAQPDGGRDAVSFVPTLAGQGFVMYQVKYVRKPFAQPDPHRWLLNILEDEAPKVALQIPKGAREFILITNVPGTAHPDSGSIDKAQAILDKRLPVPGTIWWRDDLNRRLDNAWDLKWVYPQLMSGPDLLRALVESGLSEERERRSSAIRLFLADQYASDEEVKFKQIELQNKLLDLFIDVPVVPPTAPSGRKYFSRYASFQEAALRATHPELGTEIRPEDVSHSLRLGQERPSIGAATMLLDGTIQTRIPYIVLEGAPGQGKSTISQYVAQVHRMRLLNRYQELESIPRPHRESPVRLPFKVDLRDLSVWLGRRDPFNPDETAQPAGWQKSIESFLAALVRHHAGGAEFSIADLHAVSRHSTLLLILDGLDEVADIKRRGDVVDEVVKGVRRLKEISSSLQCVVTSRPAAFANSPGMPSELFHYFQLDAVTKPLVEKYTERWLNARKLQGRERAEVRRIIRDKLDQPHLRDLARNPMQLAILLSLIHSKGVSLPDKRTALYDSYVELFFSRESEKSAVVREHRDLLIDIHRFLAWTLHSEAERGQTSGSISRERLELEVTAYLATEGHDSSLVTDLFAGVVERVVALVSRVEGTYEFEVQPLREYFAARYLYETAPYSPPGNERGGTKPDRFDALARNFYWLNVARFYSGCFSKGELPALVDRLQELTRSDGYSRLAHPRLLASTLLNDWVFAQHPRSVKEVVALVLDPIALRFLVNAERRSSHGPTTFTLPQKNGREELIDRSFAILATAPPPDYAYSIVRLLQANAAPDELLLRWRQELLKSSIERRTHWIEQGVSLGALPRASQSEVMHLGEENGWSDRLVVALMEARQWPCLESSDARIAQVIELHLDKSSDISRTRNAVYSLEWFSQTMSVFRYGLALILPEPTPLVDIWKRHASFGGVRDPKEDRQSASSNVLLAQCDTLSQISEREAAKLARDWATDLTPWNTLAEAVTDQFGPRWWTCQFATVAAGIRSTSATAKGYGSLFDETSLICQRARHARLRAGNIGWWERTLDAAGTELEHAFSVLLITMWGSEALLLSLIPRLNEILSAIPEPVWNRLHRAARLCTSLKWGGMRRQGDRLDPFLSSVRPSARTATLLGIRADTESMSLLYDCSLSDYQGSDVGILSHIQTVVYDRLMRGTQDHEHYLQIIGRNYSAGISAEDWNYYRIMRRHVEDTPISLALAHRITNEPDRYPASLLAVAEEVCQVDIAERVRPIGIIAEEEGWTFN
jgi:hypothetical protein